MSRNSLNCIAEGSKLCFCGHEEIFHYKDGCHTCWYFNDIFSTRLRSKSKHSFKLDGLKYLEQCYEKSLSK